MPQDGEKYSNIKLDHSFDLELPGKCGVQIEREGGLIRVVIHDGELTIGLKFSVVSALNMAKLLNTSGKLASRWLSDRVMRN